MHVVASAYVFPSGPSKSMTLSDVTSLGQYTPITVSPHAWEMKTTNSIILKELDVDCLHCLAVVLSIISTELLLHKPRSSLQHLLLLILVVLNFSSKYFSEN